ITFEIDPADPFHPTFPPPAPPTTTLGAAPTYTLDVVDGAGTVIVTSAGPYNSGHLESLAALMHEDYSVTVTSSYGCHTTETYTVPYNPEVVTLTAANVVKQDALY